MIEEWKSIIGFENYQVSNLGQVRRSGKVLRAHQSSRGYLQLELSKGGVQTKVVIHRLVARAFIGEMPTAEHQVNHKDGVKVHNSSDNLEWVTRSENSLHAARVLGKCTEEQHGRAILNKNQVREIRRRREAEGLKHEELAKIYGVTRGAIGGILIRRTWRFVEDILGEK